MSTQQFDYSVRTGRRRASTPLTAERREYIVKRLRDGDISQQNLAREAGVSQKSVWCIAQELKRT